MSKQVKERREHFRRVMERYKHLDPETRAAIVYLEGYEQGSRDHLDRTLNELRQS